MVNQKKAGSIEYEAPGALYKSIYSQVVATRETVGGSIKPGRKPLHSLREGLQAVEKLLDQLE